MLLIYPGTSGRKPTSAFQPDINTLSSDEKVGLRNNTQLRVWDRNNG